MFEHLTFTLAQEGARPAPSDQSAAPGQTTGGATNAPQQGQTSTGGQQLPPNQPQRQDPFGGTFFIIMLGVIVLMFFFSFRSQRKERKRREQMLSDLKKGDRVQTVGGILGTVADVRESEVVIKVDESSNVKLLFARSAIQSVVETKESA